MSDHGTNGYLVSLIIVAKKDDEHEHQNDAQSYFVKFRALEDTFFNEVHQDVDIGLAISEVKLANGNSPNIFTVHGCRHISDLIKSLDKLAKGIEEGPTFALTVLEAYILLCAAHVHDAPNVQKREDHPKRCNELLRKHKDLFANPAIQQIYDVASVHGGVHKDYGKDTFRVLDADNFNPPRLPLLSALLRLGDELSENAERVPQTVIDNHMASGLSKLAHAYAKSFISFEVRKESLYLTYSLYPEQQNLQVNISGKQMSFLQFLESKINVIELEARYCSQYARPAFSVEQIHVVIMVHKEEPPSRPQKTEKFSLYLNQGYPDAQHPLCHRSPELKEKGIKKLEDCFVETPPSGGSIRNNRKLG